MAFLKNELSWDVIFWGNRKYVDYVPSCWYDGKGMYKFPKYCSKSKLETLIESCDPLKHYAIKLYTAEIKKKNLKSLDEARRLCSLGGETSNVETDEPRKIDSSSDDSTDGAFEDSEIVVPERRKCKKTIHQNSTCKAGGSSSGNDIPKEIEITGNHMVEEGAETIKLTSGEYLIYKKLVQLQFDIKSLNENVINIEKQMMQLGYSSLSPQLNFTNSDILNCLPVANQENLLQLDKLIAENEDKMKELVQYLYLCGGESYHKSIYLQMKKLLSKEVAMLYSGEGRKGKESFKALKLYEAVSWAVRKRFEETTDQQIKKSISYFLAGSKDLEGGRKARQQ